MKNTIIAAVAASLLSSVSFADEIRTWVYNGKDFIGYERLSDDGFTTYNINYSFVDDDYRIVLTSNSGQKSRLRHPDFDHVLELAGDSDTAEEFLDITQEHSQELLEVAIDEWEYRLDRIQRDLRYQQFRLDELADYGVDISAMQDMLDSIEIPSIDGLDRAAEVREVLIDTLYQGDWHTNVLLPVTNAITNFVNDHANAEANAANQAAEAEAEFLASPAGVLQTRLILSIDTQLEALDAVKVIYDDNPHSGSHPVADQLKALIQATTSLEELEEIRNTHFVEFTEYVSDRITNILRFLVDV